MEGTEFEGPQHLLESGWGGEKFSSGEADRGGREFPFYKHFPVHWAMVSSVPEV